MLRLVTLVTAALAATASVPAAQDVLVLTPTPGPGEYSLLEDAVAAATDGDVILVKSGFYANPFFPAVIEGKGLTILGDETPAPRLGHVLVRGLPPGSTVTFRGLEFDPIGGTAPAASLRVEGDDGAVWVEACTVLGQGGAGSPAGFPSVPGQAGVELAGAARLTVVRSTLAGGDGVTTNQAPFGIHDASPGGPGLRVAGGGRASVQDSVLTGGDGGSDTLLGGQGDNGGHAAEVGPGQATFSGCVLVAGRGGDGCDSPSPDVCAGGDGLAQLGGSVVWAVDSTFTEGAGGTLDGGAPGLPGSDRSSQPGDTTTDLGGVHHGVEISSPVREGALGTITYRGEAGDLIGLYLSVPSSWNMLVGKNNAWHLGSPLLGPVLIVSVPDPSGELTIPFVGWSLAGTGLDSVGVFAQCLLKNGASPVRISDPTQLTIVSSVY